MRDTAHRHSSTAPPGAVIAIAAAAIALGAAVLPGALGEATAARSAGTIAPLPQRLSGTGLYVPGAKGSTLEVRREHLSFSPQYPLWSDGATKRRWMSLPPGTAIDASNPNAWQFPRGTRFWKEFSMGRPVETRLIERLADGSWRFSTYVWNEAGTDAELAPAAGIRALPVASAPRGRYTIPGEADCRACHAGAAAPVLGVGALQLSPDRDPLAPHAEARQAGDVDLNTLVARGLLRKLPPDLLKQPPSIVAPSPEARAALGYMHANCAHCHNAVDSGAGVPVALDLAHDVLGGRAGVERNLQWMLDKPSKFTPAGQRTGLIVAPGNAGESVLASRMRSRNPMTQMPPLGTDIIDTEGLALIERWINLNPKKESSP